MMHANLAELLNTNENVRISLEILKPLSRCVFLEQENIPGDIYLDIVCSAEATTSFVFRDDDPFQFDDEDNDPYLLC